MSDSVDDHLNQAASSLRMAADESDGKWDQEAIKALQLEIIRLLRQRESRPEDQQ